MPFPIRLQTVTVNQQAMSLFVPDEESVKTVSANKGIAFLYWSRIWPAAKGLAQFLLLHPGYTAAKKVTELGAGLGLPSLVAAQTAAFVLCTDCVAEAVAVVQRSAEHNGFKNLQTAVADWRQLPPDLETDTLLLSDLAYEPAVFADLQQLLRRFLQKNSTVVLATPQRLLAKDFVTTLLPSCVLHAEMPVVEGDRSTVISVMVLQQSSKK